MGINEGTLRTCNVKFDEEKRLINQIIEYLKQEKKNEVINYNTFLKNINAVEKNMEVLNDVAMLLWTGGFAASLHKVIPGAPKEPFKHLPQKEEPQPLTSGSIKFLNIVTYYQKHTFQDACNDFIVALENLYSGAYRAKSAIPKFYNFKPKGISYVRNNILEHPPDQFRWSLKKLLMSVDDAPVIEFCAIPLSGGVPKQDTLTVNLEQDFAQYKASLNRRLSTVLEDVKM